MIFRDVGVTLEEHDVDGEGIRLSFSSRSYLSLASASSMPETILDNPWGFSA